MLRILGLTCLLAFAVAPMGCGDDGCQDNADCNDNNQCTYDRCVEGDCSHPNKPNGTHCERDCFIGHGECVDGDCGVCTLDVCSLAHNRDVAGSWLVALLGFLALRPLMRRAAARPPS